jgi:hypothetical protein
LADDRGRTGSEASWEAIAALIFKIDLVPLSSISMKIRPESVAPTAQTITIAQMKTINVFVAIELLAIIVETSPVLLMSSGAARVPPSPTPMAVYQESLRIGNVIRDRTTRLCIIENDGVLQFPAQRVPSRLDRDVLTEEIN